MTGYHTPEEREAWLEWDKRRARRDRRVLLFLVLFLLINPFTCCFGIDFWGRHNVPAAIVTRLTKYPDAETLLVHSHYPGSAPLAFKYHIYWTADSVTSVKDHYERFFPEFEQILTPSGWSEEDKGKYPVIFRSYSDFLVDINILILPADQPHTTVPAMDPLWIALPDDIPKKGTIVVIAYYLNFLFD